MVVMGLQDVVGDWSPEARGQNSLERDFLTTIGIAIKASYSRLLRWKEMLAVAGCAWFCLVCQGRTLWLVSCGCDAAAQRRSGELDSFEAGALGAYLRYASRFGLPLGRRTGGGVVLSGLPTDGLADPSAGVGPTS